MDFFKAQDNARRKTWQLVGLFVVAVIALAIVANIVIGGALGFFHLNSASLANQSNFDAFANWPLVTGAVVGIVAIASAFKYLQLNAGGKTVAEALGGQPLTYTTADRSGRRLLNVVEEMSIASGLPVPPVYVLPEASINAFAAGFSAEDAVVGVTQGTVDHLSRDELQGVVAHEFSHIINADTRINLRLIAILHGLLCLGIVGYHLMRAGGHSGRNKNAMPIVLVGLAFVVVGYTGTFFGNLIKAAVSRQREYLADASAVQFTRDPNGISGALKKIGALSYGSRLDTEKASEASHMFFGQAISLFMGGLLNTHPPLDQRILAIEPGWNGKLPELTLPHGASVEGVDIMASGATAGFADGNALQVDADRVVASTGEINQQSVDAARTQIAATSVVLTAAAREPFSARALMLALLLDQDASIRTKQLASLETDAGIASQLPVLFAELKTTDAETRLSLLQRSMPALRALTYREYQRFTSNVAKLIRADEKIDLFEWLLHRLLMSELKPNFERTRRVRVRHQQINQVARSAGILISTLAQYGHADDDAAEAAFDAGLASFNARSEYRARKPDNFSALNQALIELRQLAPLRKPALLKACVVSAQSDGQINGTEAALLRAFAATLDCPLPANTFEGS